MYFVNRRRDASSDLTALLLFFSFFLFLDTRGPSSLPGNLTGFANRYRSRCLESSRRGTNARIGKRGITAAENSARQRSISINAGVTIIISNPIKKDYFAFCYHDFSPQFISSLLKISRSRKPSWKEREKERNELLKITSASRERFVKIIP